MGLRLTGDGTSDGTGDAPRHSKKEKHPSLSPELTPTFDKTIIQDPEGLDMVYLNNWFSFFKLIRLDASPRSLKLSPSYGPPLANPVRGTFEFSCEDLKKLRQKILCQLEKAPKEEPDQTNPIRLSTFVLSYSYALVSIVKTKGLERHRKVKFGFTADCRARLYPPVPANYFGNCVGVYSNDSEAEVIMEENGLAFVAHRLTRLIKNLEKGALEGAKEKLEGFMAVTPGSVEWIGVAGSPRFKVMRRILDGGGQRRWDYIHR
ncbi:hypothetical protein GH714_043686 [Hevea brasiliensis]|uniref:Uncharacterized protein n=1 Tax=Hevea brasiliensis TaxID=3981 RepID=A0A6A6K1R0_HEVBR|nr:hypothetical protein GH714_043686 [Hevea brasiliensis]